MKKGLLLSTTIVGLTGVLSVFAATFAAFESTDTISQQIGAKRQIYLDISDCSDWKAAPSKFSCYIWSVANNKNGYFVNDSFMDSVSTYVFVCTIPADYEMVIFVRQNSISTTPSFSPVGDWDANNQTVDLTIGSSDNRFKVLGKTSGNAGWDFNGDGTKYGGSWDDAYESYAYAPPA